MQPKRRAMRARRSASKKSEDTKNGANVAVGDGRRLRRPAGMWLLAVPSAVGLFAVAGGCWPSLLACSPSLLACSPSLVAVGRLPAARSQGLHLPAVKPPRAPLKAVNPPTAAAADHRQPRRCAVW